jgi:hypothetical protein
VTDYTNEQRNKFHENIYGILQKIEQRDDLEAKLFDWFLVFVEGDGTSTPENALQFKKAKLEKLLRMKKRVDKQVAALRPEVTTLTQIVRRRATGDHANGTSPGTIPDI